ncbi:MAG: MBL fold metallo-hydrolase [Anaerovoracaceae bacterium]|jgi:L-ascorbate metabolism protein UlaG (beta-lactamase superfamily)
METIKIRWLGHSCFQITDGDYTIITDPYKDGSVPGYPPLRATADRVIMSHGHDDHNAEELITIPEDSAAKTCPWTITEIPSYHDESRGAKRGTNTIRILDDGTFRIAFMGDFGCDLPPSDKKKLKGLDLMMMPVGGYFTLPPKRIRKIVRQLDPVVMIPMHYRFGNCGYDVIGTVEDYAKLCDDVVRYDSDTFELKKGMEKQTAILTFQGK